MSNGDFILRYEGKIYRFPGPDERDEFLREREEEEKGEEKKHE